MNSKKIENLDNSDPLKSYKKRFNLPENLIYLNGNSLGPLPRSVPEYLDKVIKNEWGQTLIGSWNKHNWISLPSTVGAKIGQIIGAEPNSVVCADSTSVNLYKLLSAALHLQPDRNIILSDTGNFPNDLYIIQGLIGQLGNRYKLRLVEPEDIRTAITKDVSVAVITEIDYRTDRRHNMTELNTLAQTYNVKIIWDLCHSAGAVPVNLSDCCAELAVGCTYKYLNGGPGSPAFLYVNPELQEAIQPPLSGWMGHLAPFDFDVTYRPAEGILRNLCGTPNIISMKVLDKSLEIWKGVDMKLIQRKSEIMFAIFSEIINPSKGSSSLTLKTTFSQQKRGSQISFAHPDGFAIIQALIDKGVVGDFREPDILRFGLTPLYLSYRDVYNAANILLEIMKNNSWDQPKYRKRGFVT